LSNSEQDTATFATQLASLSSLGDTLLLTGEIGAGKSYFARQFILSLLAKPEDIPSPTFTLVQTYETHDLHIWHCDLYRLTDVSEVEELGLLDAFETAVCLVEWPEKLGFDKPQNALHLSFKMLSDTNRSIDWTTSASKWAAIKGLSND